MEVDVKYVRQFQTSIACLLLFFPIISITRVSASFWIFHLCFVLQQAGYYDPSNQYAATNSLAAAAAGNRGDASSNLSSMSSTSVSTTSASSGAVGSASSATGNSSSISSHNAAGAATTGSGSMGSSADKSAFGNVVSANDSTSSPIPSSSTQQNLQQNAAATPATLNFATNAFAAQQQALPPGYAYFYGQIPNVQAAYGGASMYPATMAVPTAAGGTTSTQFQKSYGTSYGSTGYDALGQQGSKDFGSSYSGNTASGKSSGAAGSSGAGGAGKGEYLSLSHFVFPFCRAIVTCRFVFRLNCPVVATEIHLPFFLSTQAINIGETTLTTNSGEKRSFQKAAEDERSSYTTTVAMKKKSPDV